MGAPLVPAPQGQKCGSAAHDTRSCTVCAHGVRTVCAICARSSRLLAGKSPRCPRARKTRRQRRQPIQAGMRSVEQVATVWPASTWLERQRGKASCQSTGRSCRTSSRAIRAQLRSGASCHAQHALADPMLAGRQHQTDRKNPIKESYLAATVAFMGSALASQTTTDSDMAGTTREQRRGPSFGVTLAARARLRSDPSRRLRLRSDP